MHRPDTDGSEWSARERRHSQVQENDNKPKARTTPAERETLLVFEESRTRSSLASRPEAPELLQVRRMVNITSKCKSYCRSPPPTGRTRPLHTLTLSLSLSLSLTDTHTPPPPPAPPPARASLSNSGLSTKRPSPPAKPNHQPTASAHPHSPSGNLLYESYVDSLFKFADVVYAAKERLTAAF
jgi:hypothetical protein